jgi:molybdenum cofactor cytidylyltransferase
MIAGIILAAGASKRMGMTKLSLSLGGKPVLLWVVDAALASKLDLLICVVRPDGEEKLLRELGQRGIQVAVNAEADLGQSSSLRLGLRALPPESEAALFLLGDQPLLPSRVINEIVRVYQKGHPRIVAPEINGRLCNPVLFDRSLFAELEAVRGDQGGREIIRMHGPEAVRVPLEDPAFARDIDTPEDWQEIIGLMEAMR